MDIKEKTFRLTGRPNPVDIHNDEEIVREAMFGGPVVSGAAATFYLDQILQQHF